MTDTDIGVLLLNIILGVLVAIFVVLAIYFAANRKESPSSKHTKGEDESKSSPEKKAEPKPAKTDNHTNGHGHGGGGIAGKIAKLVMWCVVCLFLAWFFLSGNAMILASRATIALVKIPLWVLFEPGHRGSSRSTSTLVVDETKVHSISFTYETPPDWIQNPPGNYESNYETKGDKAIAMQCTASLKKPAMGASGPAYLCNPGVTVNWYRPLAISKEQGRVTFLWRNHRVVP